MDTTLITVEQLQYITESDFIVNIPCKSCKDIIYGKCCLLSIMLKINDTISVEHLGYFCNSCGETVDEIIEELNNK